MTPEHARELLGGLAAGILTTGERQTLFEAALHDQTLFNEVADELEFSVFLQSAETRAQLANRIEVEPEPPRRWSLRPAWLTLSGVLAASCVVFVVLWHRPNQIQLESVAVPPTMALNAPPPAAADKIASDKKEPVKDEVAKKVPVRKEPVVSKAAGEPKPVATSKPESRAQQKDAAFSDAATVAQPAAQPDAHQTVAGSGPPPGQRFAPPMAPRAAPAPPPPTSAPAPAPMASLTGTVHDAAGAAIPGATVDIVNTATNATAHATSDAAGKFVASSLPQGGPYTVTVVAPGFTKEKRSGITLTEHQPAQLDLPLQLGAVTEAVEVAAAMPATQQGQRQNQIQVAVLDFANGFVQSQSGSEVADLVSNQLGNNGQVHVIDREKVQQAAQSQNVAGRRQNAQEAVALGRSLGADAVIVGSVQGPPAPIGGLARLKSKKTSTAAPNVSVTAEIIDIKQTKPPVTVSAGGASLQAAANELGNQIQSTLAPVEGSVTRLDHDLVSIKFASPPALAVGALCDVIRGKRKIGEVTITSVNGLYAFGEFTGGRPRTGDRVMAVR